MGIYAYTVKDKKTEETGFLWILQTILTGFIVPNWNFLIINQHELQWNFTFAIFFTEYIYEFIR